LIIGEREGMVNFFKRKSDGTLNAKVIMKTASGATLGMASNSCPAVADWNGDGLLDVLVSSEVPNANGGGLIKLFINKGTAQDYSFEDGVLVKTSDGQAIKDYERVRIQVVDLNYDGKLDLVMGEGWNSNAGFWFFENIGSTTAPSLKQPVKLKKKDGSDIAAYLDAGPCFADWNSDGGLDLIAAGKGLEKGIGLYFGDVVTGINHNKNSTVKSILKSYSVVNGQLSVTVNFSGAGNIVFTIVSLNGRVIHTENARNLSAGNHKITVNLRNIPRGVFLLQCIRDGMHIMHREESTIVLY
jgi:hypothetical protein